MSGSEASDWGAHQAAGLGSAPGVLRGGLASASLSLQRLMGALLTVGPEHVAMASSRAPAISRTKYVISLSSAFDDASMAARRLPSSLSTDRNTYILTSGPSTPDIIRRRSRKRLDVQANIGTALPST